MRPATAENIPVNIHANADPTVDRVFYSSVAVFALCADFPKETILKTTNTVVMVVVQKKTELK